MSIDFGLGNIIVRPSNEVTLARISPKTKGSPTGQELWGQLFKRISTMQPDLLSKQEKFPMPKLEEIAETQVQPPPTVVPYLKALKMATQDYAVICDRCPHSEEIAVHVRRGSKFQFEIQFNRPWNDFDILKLYFSTGNNNDNDDDDDEHEKRVEELSINLNNNNDEDKTPEDTNWWCKVVSNDSRTLKVQVHIPKDVALTVWHLMFTLQSSRSEATLHNSVLPGIQIV